MIVATTVPQDNVEARIWQDILLSQPKSVPFPVAYETNEDLIWSKNERGRLCVRFSGLNEHLFQVYCDQRQLKYFQRFIEDQEIKRQSKDQHSSALFTLRSGRIAWQEGENKGEPWTVHHLRLYCTLDTRLWTQEGTQQVKQEKATNITQILTRMKEKGNLTPNQQAFVQRKHSTLARLDTSFPRPHQPLYQGQSHFLVGVALGLKKPATAAVVDGSTGKAITYRSIKQLLGDNYKLLNRQRQQQQRQASQRHKAQKLAANNQFGESELGKYIDRLLAKAIVELAQTYQAGSIVVPTLGNIRESVEGEIHAQAQQKIPGCIEAQKKYAKQYRMSVHSWSYGRLIETIRTQAEKVGITVEEGTQSSQGSPQEKARELALSAYQARTHLKKLNNSST